MLELASHVDLLQSVIVAFLASLRRADKQRSLVVVGWSNKSVADSGVL